MDTEGVFAPATANEARERYAAVEPAARTVVREIVSATTSDRDTFQDRLTDDLVRRGWNAVFASLLEVTVGSRAEYEDWRADFDGSVTEVGSEHVTRVVWHAFDGRAVAATFEDEPAAAIATLRRQAFGRLYRDHLSV